MKLFLAASAAITLFALPAMAQSTTVEFASSDGTTALVVFYENGTASMDGGDPIPYTMDEESKTICGQTPEGDICATFDELGEDQYCGPIRHGNDHSCRLIGWKD